MSITVLCPHGHAVVVDDPRREHACPRCGAILTAASAVASPLPPGAMAARPEPRRSRDEDEDDKPRPRKRRPREDENEDEDEDDRPRKRKEGGVQAGPPRKRAAAPVEQEEEGDDEEPGEERVLTRKQKRMWWVRLGLAFHVAKFWLMSTGLLLGFALLPMLVFAAMSDPTGAFIAVILAQLTFGFGVTLAPLVGTAGSIMCALAPPKSATRGTIIVSIIFDLLAPFLALAHLILWLAWDTSGDDRVRQLLAYMLYTRIACTLISWWLVQMYLRKLCWFMRESNLAAESLNVIVHLLLATVITPTLFVATILINTVFIGLVPAILFFVTLAWLIFFAVTFPYKQLRLLSDVRHAIWKHYLKPEDDD